MDNLDHGGHVAKEFGVTVRIPFYQSDLSIDTMTLVVKRDLDMVKIDHHTKNEMRRLKVIAYTDRQYENITLPTYSGGNNNRERAWACERLKSQNRVSTELEADWQSWQSCEQLHCL